MAAEQKSVAELERLLQEALQRAENAERDGKEQRQRAEQERQRANASEEAIRPTTLDEYIAACHTLVFSRLTVETNRSLSTKGSTTNPRNKWCPKNLRPWSEFIHEQRLTYGILNERFPVESRVFENRNFLAVLGDRVSRRRIADEKALEYFLHNSVEDPVRVIIEKLREVGGVAEAFDIGNGVVFENHPHALNDISEEVVENEVPEPPQTPGHGRDRNQLRPDQICVTRSNAPDGPSTMVYISEYKSPCKLTVQHLRAGLRPMDIYKEVVNRRTIPTSVDPDGNFKYNAEKLTASAITQTYHYMIESGLEYGNLTIGQATVFLKIDWDEPETLLYHLAEPKYEAPAHPDNFYIRTAVGQYLAFTLMALGSPGEQHEHGQEERQRAMNKLNTWAADFESTLRSIPENERSLVSAYSPDYEPTTYDGGERSPYLLRRARRQACDPAADDSLLRTDDREEPSDDESARPPDTPTPAGRSTGQATRRSARLAHRPRGDGHQQGRQYCTQRCLLGLVRGGLLDQRCPNIALHCKNTSTRKRHPVSHSQWLALLRKQLQQSLDDGITRMSQSGARGVLFKVTLLAYGYTFISKGTVRAFIKDLAHEAAVYGRLTPIQGRDVPVYLGAVDLRSMNKTYYYTHRVYVVYMMFMSWGGECLHDALQTGLMGGNPETMAFKALRAIHQEGVVHRDVRFENMLFNRETGRVVMIDLERAMLIEPPPRAPLAQVVPNKRQRRLESDDKKAATTSSTGMLPYNSRRTGRAFSEDIFNAELVFIELCSTLKLWKDTKVGKEQLIVK